MRNTIIALLFLITSTPIYAYQSKYGVIRGSHESLRVKPDANSAVIREMLVGELVYDVEQSETEKAIRFDEVDFWYKATTQDGKSGYIFGSNIYRIDANREDGRKIEEILDYHFSLYRKDDKQAYIDKDKMRICYRFEFGEISKDYWYIKYDHKNVLRSGKELSNKKNVDILFGNKISYIYNINNNHPNLIFESHNMEWYYIDGYLIEYSVGNSVTTYNPNLKSETRPREFKINDRIVSINYVGRDNGNGAIPDTCDIFFDPSLRIATARIKNIQSKIVTVKQFKLYQGKFTPME